VVGGGGGFGGPGVKFIALRDTKTIYQISSCADDTHCTMTTNYGSQGEVGNLNASSGQVYETPAASGTCTGSSALHCEDGVASPNLARFFAGTNGWAYRNTGDVQYKTFGAKAFNVSTGSPDTGSGGPGGCSGGFTGISCTTLVTDWVAVMTNWCPVTPYPPNCQQFGGTDYIYQIAAKNYSEFNGIMDSDRFLADYLYSPIKPRNSGTRRTNGTTRR
jgi:hypothetical protein